MDISKITGVFSVRNLNQTYVEILTSEFKKTGYQNSHPVSITDDGILWDGNHRLEAAKKAGLKEIPHIIETPDNIRKAAHERNKAASNALPETFVDHAEEIWEMLGEKTQQQVADEIGWSRDKVARYRALRDIGLDAWELIVTTISTNVTADGNRVVTENVTTVTEGLLRNIASLKPDQQYELVSKLLKNSKYDKSDFKKDADKYRFLNMIEDYVRYELRETSDEYAEMCFGEASQKKYVDEYKKEKVGPSLRKLVRAYLDEWKRLHGYELIVGNMEDLITDDIDKALKKIKADSIDCIITDPPYGKEAIPLYEKLAVFAAKVLKPGKSLIVMTGQSYLFEIGPLMLRHMNYQWTLSYLTPGGQAVQIFPRRVNTFWKPLLWFVKGEYEGGNWIGDVTKSDVNDNDKEHHIWGQSESGMADIIERFSNTGDTICDPFMGAGTTGVVALRYGRKFIGVDNDSETVEVANERIKKELGEAEV